MLITDDLFTIEESNALVGAAGLEQHAVKIRPVDDGIGIAKALAKRRIHRNVRDLHSRQPVHHNEAIDIDRFRACGGTDAEVVQGVKGVRSDLNSGADFAVMIRLFEDGHVAALLRKSERGRQPTDAAASNDHSWSLAHIILHS